MNAERKAVGVLAAILVLMATIIVGSARTTWMTNNSGQVVVRMPACTSDWRVCQQVALVHLSEAISKYPRADQYQARWCDHWIAFDDTDDFEVTYNRQDQDLEETNVGQASMGYCDHVTDKSIYQAAKTAGGFKSLAKYGVDYKPL